MNRNTLIVSLVLAIMLAIVGTAQAPSTSASEVTGRFQLFQVNIRSPIPKEHTQRKRSCDLTVKPAPSMNGCISQDRTTNCTISGQRSLKRLDLLCQPELEFENRVHPIVRWPPEPQSQPRFRPGGAELAGAYPTGYSPRGGSTDDG